MVGHHKFRAVPAAGTRRSHARRAPPWLDGNVDDPDHSVEHRCVRDELRRVFGHVAECVSARGERTRSARQRSAHHVLVDASDAAAGGDDVLLESRIAHIRNARGSRDGRPIVHLVTVDRWDRIDRWRRRRDHEFGSVTVGNAGRRVSRYGGKRQLRDRYVHDQGRRRRHLGRR